jgi:F-type H+-transporting ATPase subunit delta
VAGEQAAGAVYGNALFEAAQAAGRLRDVQRDLAGFGRALAEQPALASVLFNPAFPERGKKTILQRLSADSDPLVRNLLMVLVDKGRLPSLPDVIGEFDDRYQRAASALEVDLTTAVEIDDEQAAALERRLSEATGRSVALARRVDPAIIGGVVLRVRDLLVDASLRGRLDTLRTTLRSARLAAGPASGGEG